MLQCVAVCCSVLQCVAMRCSAMQCGAVAISGCCNTTDNAAIYRVGNIIVLQSVAVSCSHCATCDAFQEHVFTLICDVADVYRVRNISVLQCVAVCCNVLQCVAVSARQRQQNERIPVVSVVHSLSIPCVPLSSLVVVA